MLLNEAMVSLQKIKVINFSNLIFLYLPLTNSINFLQMTANTISESADDCFANGMDSFVSKPVNLQNLRQCLQQYLPQQQ